MRPADDLPIALRLAEDDAGARLVLTDREARNAAEARIAALEGLLERRVR